MTWTYDEILRIIVEAYPMGKDSYELLHEYEWNIEGLMEYLPRVRLGIYSNPRNLIPLSRNKNELVYNLVGYIFTERELEKIRTQRGING